MAPGGAGVGEGYRLWIGVWERVITERVPELHAEMTVSLTENRRQKNCGF